MPRSTRPRQYLDSNNNVIPYEVAQDAIRASLEGTANVRYYATARPNASAESNAEFESVAAWRIYRLTYTNNSIVRKDFAAGSNDNAAVYDNGASRNITAVTQANPGVVTLGAGTWDDGTAVVNGDKIEILSATGMTEINLQTYYVDSFDDVAFTFNLHQGNNLNATTSTNEDTSGFGAYTGSGIAHRRTYLNHTYN